MSFVNDLPTVPSRAEKFVLLDRPTIPWYDWFNRLGIKLQAVVNILNSGQGVSGTITIPKLTGGGANGSITVVDGIITGYTNPT